MSTNFIHKEGYDPKQENPNDYFPTPMLLCRNAIKDLFPDTVLRRNWRVLDAGAGFPGNWGRALRSQRPNMDLVGVDLPAVLPPVVDSPYNTWIQKDYRDLTIEDVDGRLFDMVIGNPPYSTSMGKRDMHLAEKFVEKSFELLKPEGQLYFFLRLDFLAGGFRQSDFWPLYNPDVVHICAERVNFFPERGTGQTHNHCIIEWTKRDADSQFVDPRIHFWSWRHE